MKYSLQTKSSIFVIIVFLFSTRLMAIDVDTLWYKPNIKAQLVKFSAGGDSVFVYTGDTLHIFNTDDGTLLKKLRIGENVDNLLLIPNKNSVLAGYSYNPDSNYLDKPLITKWDTDNGDSITVFKPNPDSPIPWLDSYAATHLSVSRDGRYVVAMVENRAIDIRTAVRYGDKPVVFDLDSLKIFKFLNDTVMFAFAYSPTDDVLAARWILLKGIILYNASNYLIIDSLLKEPVMKYDLGYMEFSSDGQRIFSFDDGVRQEIGIYDMSNKSNIQNINVGFNVYVEGLKVCNGKNQIYLNLRKAHDIEKINIGIYGIAENDSIGNINIQSVNFDISPNSTRAGFADTAGNFIMIVTPELPNGVNESSNSIHNEIIILTNPATDFIEITKPSEGLEPSEGFSNSVRIFNVFGETVVKSSEVLNNSQFSIHNCQFRIDVSGLPSGVYFVRVGDKVRKFVKI